MNNSKTSTSSNDEKEDHPTVEEEDEQPSDAWVPNLHWLTDEMAIGGCFPIARARDLATLGIKAVVDLRAEERDDEAALRAAGIELLHLPSPDMEPARLEQLDQGVAFVRDQLARGGKVLIHCQHGIGRSALLALCALVDEGWQPLDALTHAKNCREVISPSRAQYDGWAAWLRSRRIDPPDYHAFGCVAYRSLANG
jgi:protein tyrosine phosphatase (PTP) superfamily phosphohydrolase (DUF442 family)